MPEATMNKDECLVHRGDEIRFARQFRVVETVAETIRVKSAPQEQLGLVFLPRIPAIIRDRVSLFTTSATCAPRSLPKPARIGAGLYREMAVRELKFAVVDLFAGPGGLAEGFSAVTDSCGYQAFSG